MTWFFYQWGGGSFRKFAQYSSDNKKYSIFIKAKNPEGSFGPQEFKIILNGKNCNKQIIITQLYNDGAQARVGEEVKTEFTDDTHAIIIFDGKEQKPETIEIFFNEQENTIEVIRTQETP